MKESSGNQDGVFVHGLGKESSMGITGVAARQADETKACSRTGHLMYYYYYDA